MALPILKHPTFTFTLPISKQKITYRPYQAREEKILLIGLQSSETKDIIQAVKQVVSNCIIEEIDPGTLPTFDLEILMILLRMVSTSNQVELAYLDEEDGEIYKFVINLQDIIDKNIQDIKIPSREIILDEDWGVTMKYITIDMFMSNMLEDINNPDKMYEVIGRTIEKVYSLKDDEIFFLQDSPQTEIDAFLASFSKAASENVAGYFENLPQITHTIQYTNKKKNAAGEIEGTKRTINLAGISDFFN